MDAKELILELMTEIASLGPAVPGSISKVYSVCGKKDCICKDKKNPQKHGPYNLFSLNVGKKKTTKYIKDHDLETIEQMISNSRRLREIIYELGLAYWTIVKEEGIESATEFAKTIPSMPENSNSLSEKRLQHQIDELNKKCESWKKKATIRTHEINTLKAREKQLEESRDKWKERAIKLEEENKKKRKIQPVQ